MRELRIDHLSIRTNTNDGMYGVDIPFVDGLNIIHAENTHGKSTCIQSIIFALGLEGTLGPSRKVPLKTALTTQLRKNDGSMALISESKIYLQINNGKSFLTVMRSSNPDLKDLIRVYPNITSEQAATGLYSSNDYFLRQEGAATREKGFHFFLANFLELDLPHVIKFDGSECLLYLETIFALNYVEQTRGWGGILNILPTYLSIKDLSSKILEFTLNLDIQKNSKKRQVNQQIKKDAERLWDIGLENLNFLAKKTGGFVSDELSEKISKSTVISENSFLYRIDSSGKNTYVDRIDYLSSELILIKARITNNSLIGNSRVTQLEKELHERTSVLLQQENSIGLLIEDLDTSQKYIKSIELRINDISDSLRKYKDLVRLEKIGSEEIFNISTQKCPTCRSHIEDSLLQSTNNESPKVLGLDDSIKYLEKQRETFDSILNSERLNTQKKEARLESAKINISNTRALIREIKSSLIDIDSTPSRQDIKKELLIESEIESLKSALREESEIKNNLRGILNKWNLADAALDLIPKSGFTDDDYIKIKTLKNKFTSYLVSFGYSSNKIEDFHISHQTYKPTLNDVDINSEASASDNIRVIWSYLLSILTLDSSPQINRINHLGLLILDEPRQQEAKNESFKAFITQTAETKKLKKQVIIGTSENYSDLISITQGLDINLVHFDSDIIKKMQLKIEPSA